MIDTIRAVATYTIALVVVIGGGLLIYATRADLAATELRLLAAGFIGSALTFVFNQEVQTRTARQAAAATAASATVSAEAVHAANGTPKEVQVVNPDPIPVVDTKGPIDKG